MITEYPSFITNNTQLVLYLLRQELPPNKPIKLKNIIDLIWELTDGVGVCGQPITNSTIRCAIRQKLGTPNSEYVLVDRGIYKRIPQKEQETIGFSAYSPESVLKFAYKLVSKEFRLNPLDLRYRWEDLSEARLQIREILEHIDTARKLIENFPYREMLMKDYE